MANNPKENALSLKQLLSSDNYVIPAYQRNYAWGKAEIAQLIRDIHQSSESNPNSNYYIGALVCFKRGNGDFELIDGQQRHTTISLINAYLKSKGFCEAVPVTNLKFDSRKKAQRFLEDIHRPTNIDEYLQFNVVPGVQNFIDAIDFIREEFLEIKNIEQFVPKFYNQVKFFRVEVPYDTDLNRYFEIMNNRGEQLEKHEIVKAYLMSRIVEKKNQEIFALVWDACSNMENYIHLNFTPELRQSLFDKDGNLLHEDLSTLDLSLNTDDSEQTLEEILNSRNGKVKEEEHGLPNEKYKSVIDFPNFLLQVLKQSKPDTSLDDKLLLKSFENVEDSMEFINALLIYRILFDRYIIKQDLSEANEDKRNWGIRKPNIAFNGVVRAFEEDEELIKLETMLYYSSPSYSNNTWVQKMMTEISAPENKMKVLVSTELASILFEIAKEKFDDQFLSYPEIKIFNLYYIDFLLWKRYEEKVKGIGSTPAEGTLEHKIYQRRKSFNDFRFRQLNSKEHLLPQSEAKEEEKEVLHSLGNLCLISSSQNSEANNRHPSYKRKHYESDNSSLKRLIMFQTFSGNEWGLKEISEHEEEIRNLIYSF